MCLCYKLQGSTNLEAIQIIKKPGGSLKDSFLDEGWDAMHITLLSLILSFSNDFVPFHMRIAEL